MNLQLKSKKSKINNIIDYLLYQRERHCNRIVLMRAKKIYFRGIKIKLVNEISLLYVYFPFCRLEFKEYKLYLKYLLRRIEIAPERIMPKGRFYLAIREFQYRKDIEYINLYSFNPKKLLHKITTIQSNRDETMNTT